MNENRHLFLYAKRHYQRGDLVSDLAKIVGHMCGLKQEHVRLQDLVQVILPITFDLILKRGNPTHSFCELVMDASCTNDDYPENILWPCLSIMAVTSVKDIEGGLGEPDPEILPINVEK